MYLRITEWASMPVTIVRIFPREEITHKIRETFYRTSPPFFPINFKNLFYFIETIQLK